MQKTLMIVALGMLTLGVVHTVGAENTPPTVPFKFGMVDFQRAINETEDGKKAEASLNAALAEKKKKFEILKNELDAMRQDFEKQRLVLSGQTLEDKKQALQKKLLEVEQTGANYEQELGNKKAGSLQKILVGLQAVVQEIGQKEGYTLIFEKSQGGVLFSSSGATKDITDQVIKSYNTKPVKP